MYTRVMRHRNETCAWHVCAGHVKHVVDLDLTIGHTAPHDGGAAKCGRRSRGPEVGEHAPERITTKDDSCVEALRQNAATAGRPAVCRDTRRRFRGRGLARARAALLRERIRGAGSYG